jgi:hypothetical protein
MKPELDEPLASANKKAPPLMEVPKVIKRNLIKV